jgi:hypothetical protein
MRNRITIFIGVLFQTGCASLLNSDRPAYHGAIQSPAWHNASVQVEQTHVILDRAVYAIARSVTSSDSPRIYAFNLEAGKDSGTRRTRPRASSPLLHPPWPFPTQGPARISSILHRVAN